MQRLVILGALAASSALSSPCNLDGNWTSSRKGTPPGQVVHIEFFQPAGSLNFSLRTTPWASASYGHVGPADDEVHLLFVGGSMQRVTASEDCTRLSCGWCKFPNRNQPKPTETANTSCGFPEPSWPAWPPAVPPPPPPPPPFGPPTWTPNWNLTESTTIQPSGDSYFMPNHTWGLISLDWSVARSVWFKNGRNKTNCEEVSTEGCRKLKAAGKASKCFIYHNMELALEWEESQRKVMYDPTKADYFLQYTDGFAHKNGTIYQEDIQFGDQFFWDFTNPEAADYFISATVSSLNDPAVDGTFTDDVGG
eukprot:SAG31_NODE_10002_length_1198_cov_1.023658_1_plen_307_part_01